jgi:dephospho-CoA kinase
LTHAEIVRRFGAGVLNEDGSIDRKRLANVVFPDRIAELNSVVHPAVIEAQNRWMNEVELENPNGIAVVEAALLLEAGAEKGFDEVIVVTCGFEQKVERYAARTGLPLEAARAEVERRSAAQMKDQEKARRANYIIENSGSIDALERQVDEVWRKLQKQSTQ